MSKFSNTMHQLSKRFTERADGKNALHKDLAGRLKDLANQLEAVETLRTPQAAARLRYLAEAAEGVLRSKSTEASASFDAALREHSGLKAGAYGPEIRANIKALSPGERVKAIQALIEVQDGSSLSAIFDAPPMLSGMSTDDLGKFREQYYQVAAPDLVKAREVFSDLAECVNAAVKTSLTAALEYGDPVKLQELEAREAATARAQDALKGA